jgi:uracil-DNA glycosylase
MDVRIESSWKQALQSEFEQPYFSKLAEFVKTEYQTQTIYPPAKKIFSAFSLTPINQVKVVILGQDPYHGENQAMGLAFSVNPPTPPPPSLKNIYKEIAKDIGAIHNISGDLTHWATQGVLLLNATLTVRAHQAASHQRQGWETFTDSVIKYLSIEKQNLVFMLWGASAQKKGTVIDAEKHLVLTAPHPSPLSAHQGFFGCSHFSTCNSYLALNGHEPIIW